MHLCHHRGNDDAMSEQCNQIPFSRTLRSPEHPNEPLQFAEGVRLSTHVLHPVVHQITDGSKIIRLRAPRRRKVQLPLLLSQPMGDDPAVHRKQEISHETDR